jgi:AcrR family transcriptional regulator
MNDRQDRTRSKPGRKPSPEKRAAIAALRLFAAKGVEATSTRDIAAEAGTTERTLFKNFGSKDALVREVIENASIELWRSASFARIRDTTPFSHEELTAWHRAFLAERIAAADEAPDNYRVLFRELFRDDGFRGRYAEKWRAGVFEPFAAHLAAMQTSGAIVGSRSPRALAGAFFSLNIGYLMSRYSLAPDNSWSTKADVDAIVGMFAAVCDESS